jgi:hypothetical protein
MLREPRLVLTTIEKTRSRTPSNRSVSLPANDTESALLITLAPGNYTVIVSGSGGITGVGLVEAYHLP